MSDPDATRSTAPPATAPRAKATDLPLPVCSHLRDLTDASHAACSGAARIHIIRNGIVATGVPGFEGQLDATQVLEV